MVIYILGHGHNTKNGKNIIINFFQCYTFNFLQLLRLKSFLESSWFRLSNKYFIFWKISDTAGNFKNSKLNFFGRIISKPKRIEAGKTSIV